MTNRTTTKLFACLAILILVQACGKEENIDSNEEHVVVFPKPGQIMNTVLTGRVTDEANLPISSAEVECLSCVPQQSVQTDEKGKFSFYKVDNRGNEAFLSIKKSGKFDGFRRFPLLENRINYTSILLSEKALLAKISGLEGGQKTHTSGAEIKLLPESVVDAEGTTFTGEISVFMSWIDPSSLQMNEMIMGNLSGVAADNSLMGLSTYGMLQVELLDENDNELNLKDGSSAELIFPVPQSILDNAPSTIPLWSYDETVGYWVEEGTAILESNRYVADVSHFSTWNVDSKFNPVDITGNVVLYSDNSEHGLSYFQVRLSGNSFNGVGGWLCEDGSFTFINLPSGEELTLEVFDYCDELVHRVSLNSLNESTDIGTIIIDDSSELEMINVSGNALDCDSSPLIDGLVFLNINDRTYDFPINSDGNFNFDIFVCPGFEASITLFNKVNNKPSNSLRLSGIGEAFKFEDIIVCDANEEFLLFSTIYEDEPIRFFKTNEELIYTENFDDPDSAVPFTVVTYEDDGELSFSMLLRHELILDAVVDGNPGAAIFIGLNVIIDNFQVKHVLTELGPINANGDYEYIAGSFAGTTEEGEPISCFYRMKGK